VEKENDLHRGAKIFESPVHFQQRNLEHVDLKHLNRGILGLSFLPVSQWVLAVERASAAHGGSEVSAMRYYAADLGLFLREQLQGWLRRFGSSFRDSK
jgi:hypothetical protein